MKRIILSFALTFALVTPVFGSEPPKWYFRTHSSEEPLFQVVGSAHGGSARAVLPGFGDVGIQLLSEAHSSSALPLSALTSAAQEDLRAHVRSMTNEEKDAYADSNAVTAWPEADARVRIWAKGTYCSLFTVETGGVTRGAKTLPKNSAYGFTYERASFRDEIVLEARNDSAGLSIHCRGNEISVDEVNADLAGKARLIKKWIF